MDKKFIAKRFAQIRSNRNISARKLSIELLQGSEYINQIENGRKMPSLEGLINFCNYFDISLSEFFDESNSNPSANKDLIKQIEKLTFDERKALTDMVTAINKTKERSEESAN